MASAVKNATTAIELVHSGVSNDVVASFKDLMTASVGHQAERSLKQAKCDGEDFWSKSEAAAIAAAAEADLEFYVTAREDFTSQPEEPDVTPQEDFTRQPKDPELSFNIYDDKYQISFMPSEDPYCYKPLEIVSYIGMTKSANSTIEK